jgi:hypothetical protein
MSGTRIDESALIAFYKERTARVRPRLRRTLDEYILCTTPMGLGDPVIQHAPQRPAQPVAVL